MSQIRRRRIDKKMIIKVIFKKIVTKIMSAIRTIPIAVLCVAAIAFFQMDVLPAALSSAIPTISYVTLIFGLTITSCFNRSRGFFILLILLFSQLGLTAAIPESIGKSATLQGVYSMISVVLPLNLLFFSSLKERGIFSGWGQKSMIVILLQVAFIMGLTLPGDKDLFSGINGRFLGLSFMPETTIPDVAQITFITTGVSLFVRRRRAEVHFKTATLGVLIAIAFAHHLHNIPSAIPWFYGVAGIIMIFAVFQDNYFKAYMDELTGLPSRRSLNEDMMKLDGVYVIAMVDVDYFKKFNDTYGHDAGDDVLRLIASVMRDFKGGKAFRYGGEEFTILFPGKRLAEVIPCLEELREKIAQCKFVLRGTGRRGKGAIPALSITVSIGVAESNHKTINPEQVIKVADAALYRAKDNGRNCVSK
jgi:diguanylate cyclase (GGDEF)-like protein